MVAKIKYEVISVNHIEVMADVSLLQKTDELYFNATLIAKQFGKQTADFLKLHSTNEYIAEILKDSGNGNSLFQNLVRVTKGGKYQGTWLHQELMFEFAGWCSPLFRRNLHKWVQRRIEEEHLRQQHRLQLKTGFLPLTNAIQSAHKDLKPYHFSNECDLINRLVTGCTAKQFKERHDVAQVRDGLTFEQINVMDTLQRQNTSLIELGFDYEARKELLNQQAQKLSFFGGAVYE